MSIRENIYQVVDRIKLLNILISVFDKAGLDKLIHAILSLNPGAMFYSTGGTGKRIMEILGSLADTNYTSVEKFTGAPEMEGGLVKTLHPKIHAGLLAERGNPLHEEYLYKVMEKMTGTAGVCFDLFVGNLYPFNAVIAKEGCTPETARVNIDIGGPAMGMASMKNWHSVASLTDPAQYPGFIEAIVANGGTTDLEQRFALAQAAVKLIGEYRMANANYFAGLNFKPDVMPTLNIAGGE